MKKKIIIFFCAVLFFMVISNIFGKGWIIYHDGPYRGKVIDADTGEPIKGVAVAGKWDLDLMGPAQGPWISFCDTQEAITDSKGEFIVPRAFCFSFWPFSFLGNPLFVVFKPGYLGYPPIGPSPEERRARMPTFTGDEFKNKKKYYIIRLGKPKTREERIFTTHSVSIFSEDIIMKKAPYLLKLINEERKNLGFKGEIKPADNGRQ